MRGRRRKYGYRRPRRWQRLATVAFLIGLVVLLAIGVRTVFFGGGDPAPSPSATASATPAPTDQLPWPIETRTPPPDVVPGEGTFTDPAQVDRTNPDAVAEAAAQLLGSHDTLVDDSEADSRERAAELLIPELLELPQVENSKPDAQWLAAQEHDAYSQPLVAVLTVPALGHGHEGETPEEHAAHAEEQVWIGMPTETAEGEPALGYQFDVLYHWQGRDGWISEPDDAQKREVRLALVERDGVWVVVEAYYGEPQFVGVK